VTTTPLSSIDSSGLEIHVLGGSKGESIIIKLPDGQWGVVDCYADNAADPAHNPTVQYLRSRGVATLLFVCLTHAHDDHFLGMVKLIEEFKPAEFWRFGCLAPPHIAKLMQYNKLRSKEVGGVKGAELTRSMKELFDILKLSESGSKADTMRPNPLTSLKTLYPLPRDEAKGLKIECLAPSGKQVERYHSAILSCIGPDEQIAKELKHSDHNEVSVVLKITYGETTVILGGDLEKAGWEEVVREYGEANLKAAAVKVSHHGSENGYCDHLWKHFTVEGKTIALIAPQHRHRLPRPDALEEISKHANKIVATCKPRMPWASKSAIREPLPESRVILRTHLSAMKVSDGAPCGQCSLWFDEQGNMKLELIEPAIAL
jgi:beta-lactamase superfamily II metal-dependent hydrolase